MASNCCKTFWLTFAAAHRIGHRIPFIETTIAALKEKVGDDKVVLGLSGGVDSSVAAVLLHQAIGKNLHCIFVDNGLLRKDEYQSVLDSYQHMGLKYKRR